MIATNPVTEMHKAQQKCPPQTTTSSSSACATVRGPKGTACTAHLVLELSSCPAVQTDIYVML